MHSKQLKHFKSNPDSSGSCDGGVWVGGWLLRESDEVGGWG